MDLPTEILFRIFAYALPIDHEIHLGNYLLHGDRSYLLHSRKYRENEQCCCDNGSNNRDLKTFNALMRTCRSFHPACTALIYGTNVFDFHNPQSVSKFVVIIGQANARKIKQLSLSIHYNQDRVAFDDDNTQEVHVVPDCLLEPPSHSTWYELLKQLPNLDNLFLPYVGPDEFSLSRACLELPWVDSAPTDIATLHFNAGSWMKFDFDTLHSIVAIVPSNLKGGSVYSAKGWHEIIQSFDESSDWGAMLLEMEEEMKQRDRPRPWKSWRHLYENGSRCEPEG